MVSKSHQDELKKLVRAWKFNKATSSEVRRLVGTWEFKQREAPPHTGDSWLWRNVASYRTSSSGVNFSKRGGTDHATDEGLEH